MARHAAFKGVVGLMSLLVTLDSKIGSQTRFP